MSSNLYLTEAQDYFEGLCISHKDIQHTVNGQRCFARFQSDEQMQEVQQSGGPNVVVVRDYHGQRTGEYDDKKMRQFIGLRFACKATGTDQTTAVNSAIMNAENIMFDFMTKMQDDFEEDDCGILRLVEFEKMVWTPFEGPMLDALYGFDLEIPFKSYMPAYNPAKWS